MDNLKGNAEGVALRGSIKGFSVYHTDAYMIAVRNGFEGTEEEWLESLKGEKGDKGDIGNTGNGISMVQQNISADGMTTTTTLIMDNGDSVTFSATNGTDGLGIYLFDPAVAPLGDNRYGGGVTLPDGRTLEKYDLLMGSDGNVYQVTELGYGVFTATVLFNIIGATGADGFSPSAKVEQTANGALITLTDKNGTTSASVSSGAKGDPGEKGEPGAKGDPGEKGETGATGAAGYTPVKGKDYWTDADKAEVTAYIDNKLGDVSVELPVFDLAALGLKAIPLIGGGSNVMTDTAEICSALNKGAVAFVIPFNAGGTTTNATIVMNGASVNGMWQCISVVNYTGDACAVSVVVNDSGIQVQYSSLKDMVGVPPVTAIDLSAFGSNGTIVETFADGSVATTVMELNASGQPTKITDSNGKVTTLTW